MRTLQALKAVAEAAREAGTKVEVILLRDDPIAFCLPCRECIQALEEKVDQADDHILASPTDIGSVTALFKRFMEHLAVYAY